MKNKEDFPGHGDSVDFSKLGDKVHIHSGTIDTSNAYTYTQTKEITLEAQEIDLVILGLSKLLIVDGMDTESIKRVINKVTE